MKRTGYLTSKDIDDRWAMLQNPKKKPESFADQLCRESMEFERRQREEERAAKKYWDAGRMRLANMDAAQFNAELKSLKAKYDETEKLVGEKGVILGGVPLPLAVGTKPTADQIEELFAYKYTVEEGLKFARQYRNSIEQLYSEPVVAVAGRVKA